MNARILCVTALCLVGSVACDQSDTLYDKNEKGNLIRPRPDKPLADDESAEEASGFQFKRGQ